jgi:hypothetical protein
MQSRFEALKEFIDVDWPTFSISPPAMQNAMLTLAEAQAKTKAENEELADKVKELEGDEDKDRVISAEMRDKGEPKRIAASKIKPTKPPKPIREVETMSSQFPINEPRPVHLIGGKIIGFRKVTILAFEHIAKRMIQKAASFDDTSRCSSHGYMMFQIWTGSRRISTKAMNVDVFAEHTWESNVVDLFHDFDRVLNEIERVRWSYSDVYENDVNYVEFVFSTSHYPKPMNIANWGTSVQEVEGRQSFDIYTANDPNVNCVLQCAQRKWGSDATEDTLDKFIKRADQKVCYLRPRPGIANITFVHSSRDLCVHPQSPVKSISIMDPDTIYLLLFKDHVGILENIKEEPRNRLYTQFRPIMKYPKCEKVTVAFDIECYFDPEGEQRHIPYLCCACFLFDDKPGVIVDFTGKDCVAQMIDYCADTATDMAHEDIELIAHNGGGYDFHYLLTCMYDPRAITDILARNTKLISFKFKHQGIYFSVKDTLNFLGCSLSSAAKSFLTDHEGKTDFPHHELCTEEDLKKVFNEWIKVDTIVSVNTEKEKMLITSEHVIQYNEGSGQAKELIEWSKTYCRNDVLVLAKVWIAFKRTIFDIFNCHVVEDTLTLAGMSFRLLEAHLPPNVKLGHQKREVYDHMRAALVGGRCVSLNGVYKNIMCLDVKSLYPAVMAFYDQPYGSTTPVLTHVKGTLGIYHVKVTPVQRKQHGFFPLRKNGEVDYAGAEVEPYTAWYTSVDIDIGISEGHKFEYVPFDEGKHVGYVWKQKGKIFKKYIEGVYKLKLQFEQEGNKEKRWAVKIIMNSLWGKFAQKWMDTRYLIMSDDDADLVKDFCTKIFDTDYMMVRKHAPTNISQKPIQNGVFVLSWARHHMKRIWDACTKPDAVCIYSDTDSIFVSSDSIKEDAMFELDGKVVPVIGDAMGQLEVECVFEELTCVGKKQYMGFYFNEKGEVCYKKRFKGVPQENIKPEMFGHLIKTPSHTAQITFLKFQRQWGSIRGYNESKIVRQT